MRALLLLLLAASHAHADDGKWSTLLAQPVNAVWSRGADVIAVGARAWASHDGGKTWTDAALGTRGAGTLWARDAHDAYALGSLGGDVWHGDGAAWPRVPVPAREMALAVAGNADRVIIVGEKGLVLTARAGGAFTVEPSGSRATLRAVWVAPDGSAVAAGEDGAVYVRAARGRWRRRLLAKGDIFCALASSADGTLWALTTAGRLFRSSDAGAHFADAGALPLGLRSWCTRLSIAAGGELHASCMRPVDSSPMALMAKEPRMTPYFVHGSPGKWIDAPLAEGQLAVIATPDALFAVGSALWRYTP